jgi:hypothetical protein
MDKVLSYFKLSYRNSTETVEATTEKLPALNGERKNLFGRNSVKFRLGEI